MKHSGGYSLIELLVATAVFGVIIAATATMVNMSTIEAGKSKVTLVAITLAQNRIEAARNAPYLSVGTVLGNPSGIFPQTETVPMNNLSYTLKTTVIYMDDPADGTEALGTDETPTDYKRIRAEVSWDGVFAVNKPVVMETDIANRGTETDGDNGTLVLTVINALGEAVPTAQVQITAPSLTPPINMNLTTNDQGTLELPGFAPCNECYAVSVTKSGYTTDKTYSRSEVANPNKPLISVLSGEVSRSSFTIDLPSTVTFKAVRTRAENWQPFQGVGFRVHGLKEIGRTTMDQPVYKTDTYLTTGIGGQITRNNWEWDTYVVDIPDGSSVDMAGSTPFTPFIVSPHSNSLFTMVVAASSTNTLLVRILDNLLVPIASASVELKNDLESYLATAAAGTGSDPDRAQVFFSDLPSASTPFTLTISSLDMATVSAQATISGDMVENYLMNPL